MQGRLPVLSAILLFSLLSIVAPAPLSAADRDATSVQFRKRPPQVGDLSQQQIHCDLNLEMSIRQSGQVVQAQKHGLVRSQNRELTILQTSGNVPTKAVVRYKKSEIALQTGDEPAAESEQPVAGKSYLVSRTDAGLQITYPDGTQPGEEELAVLRSNMETFGLPNPIATFFDQREIQIGQKLQLPAHLARELLGFPDTVRNVSNFALVLRQLRQSPDGKIARFDIQLQAAEASPAGVQMALKGVMEIEVDTCRTRVVRLNGPVQAVENHGPPANQFQVHSEGKIDVAVRAEYPLVR